MTRRATRVQDAVDALTLLISGLSEIRDALKSGDIAGVERTTVAIPGWAIPGAVFAAIRELKGVPEFGWVAPDSATPVAASRV